MTIGQKTIAACELIERLGGGSSIDVRDALGMKSSNASHLVRQAISKGLLIREGAGTMLICVAAKNWRQIVEVENQPTEPYRARVLRALDRPSTVRQLCEKLGASPSRIRNSIKELSGSVFVSGWVNSEAKGVQSAIYSRGQGVTPPRQVYVSGATLVLEALPGAVCDIVKVTGLSRSRALDILLGLADKKKAYISGRGDSGAAGRAPAVYSRGQPKKEPVRKFECRPAPESSVQHAIRTQPTSVWALSSMGARA